MQKIPRAIGKASGTAIGETNSSGTLSIEGGGLSTFAGVVTSRRGKPFTVLAINKGNFRDILGAAFHPNEQPQHYEPIRHLNQALNGGPGYVVRVVPSDMEIPFVKFSTPGNSNVPGSQPDVDPTQSTFNAFPGNATADGQSSITLTFTARDKNGNLLKGLGFVSFDATGVAVTIGKTTESNGVYSASLTGIVPGKVIIRPTVARKPVGNLSSQISMGQMPNQVATLDPDQCTFWLSNSRVYADGKSAITLYLQLKDTTGAPLSIQESRVGFVNLGSINLNITDAIESLSQVGLYTAQLSGKEVGSATIVPVIDGGMIGDIRGSLVYLDKTPGSSSDNKVDGNQSTFTTSKNRITADGTDKVTLTITARNASGSLMPGIASSMGIAVYNLTGVTKTDFVEYSAGVYQTDITVARSSSGDRAEIQALYNGLAIDRKKVVINVDRIKEQLPVVDDSASTLVASANTGWATGGVGADSEITLTLTLIDTQGQPMPHRAVLFNVVGAANLTAIEENQPGVYTVDVFSYNENNVTVVPMLDGIAVGTLSAAIEFKRKPVVVSPLNEDLSASTLSLSPSSIPADGKAVCAVSIQLVDKNGKPVTGQESNLGLNVSNIGLDAEDWLELNDGYYVAELTSEVVGAYAISATYNGVKLGTVSRTLTVQQVAIVPDPSRSKITVSPAVINDDGSETATLTLSLRTSGNKVISGFESRVGFDVSDLQYVTITEAKETGATGIYTSVVTGKSIKGSVTIRPQFDGKNIGNRSVDLTLVDPATVTPLPTVILTHSTFTTDVDQIRADKGEKANITFRAIDDKDQDVLTNLMPYLTFKAAQTTGFTISPVAVHGNGTYTATVESTSSTASGDLVIDAMFNSAPVMVSDGNGGTKELEITIKMVGAVDAAQSVFAAPVSSVKANGTAVSTLSFTAKDALGTNVNGAVVDFTFTGTAAATVVKGSVTTVKGVTSVTIANIAVGDVLVGVTVDGTPLTITPVTVSFTAPYDESQSRFDAAPSKVIGDGVAKATITLTLNDDQGAPVTGIENQITFAGFDGTNDVDLSGVVVKEKASGVYSLSYGLLVTADTTVTFTPSFGADELSMTDTVLFTVPVTSATQPEVQNSSIESSLASGVHGLTDGTPVTITIKLNKGVTPVPGKVVELVPSTTPLSTTTISNVVETSTNSGIYTATISATGYDEFDLSVKVNSADFGLSPLHVVFGTAPVTPTEPVDADSEFTRSGGTAHATADGSDKVTLTVLLKAGSTMIQGKQVEFVAASKQQTSTIGPVSEPTPGTYTADVTATAADSFDITMTVGGAPFNKPAVHVDFDAVIPTTPDVASSTFVSDKGATHLTANDTDTATLTLTLLNGTTPIKGKTVVFEATGAKGSTTISAVTETPSDSGIYIGTVKASAADSITVTVKVDGSAFAIAGIPVVFDAVVVAPAVPDKAKSTLTAPAGSHAADSDVVVTAVLKTSADAAVTGGAAKLKLFEKGTTNAAVSGVTFTEDSTTHGTYTATYHIPTASTGTLHFTLEWDGTELAVTPLDITVS